MIDMDQAATCELNMTALFPTASTIRHQQGIVNCKIEPKERRANNESMPTAK